MRPIDFAVIGFPKAGTTWCWEALNGTDEFFVPAAKDTYYFDRHFERGDAWYAPHFAGRSDAQLAGEVCHDYIYSPEALERLADHGGPEFRPVVVLRDPVDRSVSHLRYALQMRRVTSVDYAEVLEQDREIISRSFYHTHLAAARDVFGTRLTVLFFEDLTTDPYRFARDLFAACGNNAAALNQLPAKSNRSSTPRISALVDVARIASDVLDRTGNRQLLGKLKSSRLKSMLFSTDGDTAATQTGIAEFRARASIELEETRRHLAEDFGIDRYAAEVSAT